MAKKQSLTVKKASSPSLENRDSMMGFATDLKRFIVSQKLYTPIQGKNYVNVEGWQFAGGSMGLIAVVDKCERLERTGTEVAYRAEVVVYSGDKIVSRGIAICSSNEGKKKSFDEYAIASMAQTRAVGKAYRLLLGWLMKAAGYEGTPAEEMKEEAPKAPKKEEFRGEEVIVESHENLEKLVEALKARGAKTKPAALKMLNDITDAQVPSFDEIGESDAKRYLAKILMTPETVNA